MHRTLARINLIATTVFIPVAIYLWRARVLSAGDMIGLTLVLQLWNHAVSGWDALLSARARDESGR